MRVKYLIQEAPPGGQLYVYPSGQTSIQPGGSASQTQGPASLPAPGLLQALKCNAALGLDLTRLCLSSTKSPLSWGKGGPSCLGKIESVPFIGPLGLCPSQSLAFLTPIQTRATAYFTHLPFMFS